MVLRMKVCVVLREPSLGLSRFRCKGMLDSRVGIVIELRNGYSCLHSCFQNVLTGSNVE